MLIKPDGIYEMERNDDLLTQFDNLEIRRRYENQSSNLHSFRYVSIESYFEGDGFVNTTINWLTLDDKYTNIRY